MKKLTMFIFGLCVGASLFIFALNSGCSPSDAETIPKTDAGKKEWMTNLEAAMKLSKESGKPILVDISGSTWCRWCIALNKEVFSKKIFKDFAKKNLILVLLDFPYYTNAKQKQKLINLNKKYGFQGFPTVLLLDSKGKLLVKTSYREGGAQKYVDFLKTKMPAKKVVKAKK